MELSGILASGMAPLVYPGAVAAEVVKVKTPEEETL